MNNTTTKSKYQCLVEDSDIEDCSTSEEDDDEITILSFRRGDWKSNEKIICNKYASLNTEVYPPFEILKKLPLKPRFPNPSPRYGDPDLTKCGDFDHYIIEGKTYPPLRLLKEKANNSMLKRKPERFNNTVVTEFMVNAEVAVSRTPLNLTSNKNVRREVSRYCSKPLIQQSKFVQHSSDYLSIYNFLSQNIRQTLLV